MGAWEWISSAINFVKQNTPDVAPVTEVCRKGYDFSRETATQVDGTCRSKARELQDYFSDDEVRANVFGIATSLSKNGALYLARYYGGGPVIDVVMRSLQVTKVDSQRERIRELETRVSKLEKELNALKTTEQVQMPSSSMLSKAGDKPDFYADLTERPKDVLREFMMVQFVGTRLLDDLIVPGTGSTDLVGRRSLFQESFSNMSDKKMKKGSLLIFDHCD